MILKHFHINHNVNLFYLLQNSKDYLWNKQVKLTIAILDYMYVNYAFISRFCHRTDASRDALLNTMPRPRRQWRILYRVRIQAHSEYLWWMYYNQLH